MGNTNPLGIEVVGVKMDLLVTPSNRFKCFDAVDWKSMLDRISDDTHPAPHRGKQSYRIRDRLRGVNGCAERNRQMALNREYLGRNTCLVNPRRARFDTCAGL